MPRKPRYIMPGLPHHIVQRGNNRQYVFNNDIDKRFFLKKMRGYAGEYSVKIGAYCVMSNHVHLLVYPETEEGLVLFMKMTFQVYSQYINMAYRRTGKLWENRYKMHVVDPRKALIVAKYIDLNPVRARMVGRGDQYAYSSCRAHLGRYSDKNLSYDLIEGLHWEYLIFLNEQMEHTSLQNIRETLQQEKVFGGREFVAKIEGLVGRILSVRKRGRPSLVSESGKTTRKGV